MKKTKFTNEIGNKITIKVKNKKDIGTNYKTKKKIKFNGTSIKISGPISESQWVITKMEAIELYKVLGIFIKQ